MEKTCSPGPNGHTTRPDGGPGHRGRDSSISDDYRVVACCWYTPVALLLAVTPETVFVAITSPGGGGGEVSDHLAFVEDLMKIAIQEGLRAPAFPG